MIELTERFWKKVNKDGPVPGGPNKYEDYAHRLAYEWRHGSIDPHQTMIRSVWVPASRISRYWAIAAPAITIVKRAIVLSVHFVSLHHPRRCGN